MEITCSGGHPCQYRFQGNGSVGWSCNYTGYCDFQLPRDSRWQPLSLNEPYKQCTCGQTSISFCPIHGKK